MDSHAAGFLWRDHNTRNRYLVTVISTEPGGHCTGRGHSSARVGGLRTVGYQLF